MVDRSELMKFHVDERAFRLRPGEVTARIARLVRIATDGVSAMKILSMLETDPDIDLIAGLCFIAELQTNPDTADYKKLEDWITYESVFSLDEDNNDEDDEDDNDPEI